MPRKPRSPCLPGTDTATRGHVPTTASVATLIQASPARVPALCRAFNGDWEWKRGMGRYQFFHAGVEIIYTASFQTAGVTHSVGGGIGSRFTGLGASDPPTVGEWTAWEWRKKLERC